MTHPLYEEYRCCMTTLLNVLSLSLSLVTMNHQYDSPAVRRIPLLYDHTARNGIHCSESMNGFHHDYSFVFPSSIFVFSICCIIFSSNFQTNVHDDCRCLLSLTNKQTNTNPNQIKSQELLLGGTSNPPLCAPMRGDAADEFVTFLEFFQCVWEFFIKLKKSLCILPSGQLVCRLC